MRRYDDEYQVCEECGEVEQFDSRTGLPDFAELWVDRDGETQWMHWGCVEQHDDAATDEEAVS